MAEHMPWAQIPAEHQSLVRAWLNEDDEILFVDPLCAMCGLDDFDNGYRAMWQLDEVTAICDNCYGRAMAVKVS